LLILTNLNPKHQLGGKMSQFSSTKSIPVRRVEITDPNQLPSRYSETPGGTLFSTTPGGTRIIYERKFLLDMKSSPLSQTPTKLPIIPGVTLDDHGKIIEEDEDGLSTLEEAEGIQQTKPMQDEKVKKPNEDELFEMDM